MTKLKPGDHTYLLYQEPDHLWSFLATTFQHGLAQGEQCCYVVEEYAPEVALAALEAQGLPATELQDQGRLVIQGTEMLPLSAQPFAVEAALSGWLAAAQQATAAGYRGLCLAVDMAWVLRHPSALAQLAEYEAQVEIHFAGRPVTAICQYNQRRFPEEILLDVLGVHPFVALEGVRQENIYYLPPDIFLQQDRRAQFYWYLRRLAGDHRPLETGLTPPLASPGGKASPWPSIKRKRVEVVVPEAGLDPALESPPSPNRRWQIYCLGELRVFHHDNTPVNWGAAKAATRKVKTLFAYLLEAGKRGATIEQLADLLWPDQEDMTKALDRLYHTIFALRQALEPNLRKGREARYLIIRKGHCFLELPPDSWLDVTAFEQFCYRGEQLAQAGDDENALPAYLVAHNLYAGDLFLDIPVVYTERIDDDWCWSRRYWLREMYLKVLAGLTGLYRRQGKAQEALSYARQLLAIDPCHEATHREMMQLFAQTGRPDALDRQYHLCQEVLRRHESREPEAETVQLYHDLKRINL